MSWRICQLNRWLTAAELMKVDALEVIQHLPSRASVALVVSNHRLTTRTSRSSSANATSTMKRSLIRFLGSLMCLLIKLKWRLLCSNNRFRSAWTVLIFLSSITQVVSLPNAKTAKTVVLITAFCSLVTDMMTISTLITGSLEISGALNGVKM